MKKSSVTQKQAWFFLNIHINGALELFIENSHEFSYEAIFATFSLKIKTGVAEPLFSFSGFQRRPEGIALTSLIKTLKMEFFESVQLSI